MRVFDAQFGPPRQPVFVVGQADLNLTLRRQMKESQRIAASRLHDGPAVEVAWIEAMRLNQTKYFVLLKARKDMHGQKIQHWPCRTARLLGAQSVNQFPCSAI